MFSLCLERGKYCRVRQNIKKADIERLFGFPVISAVFVGAIIPVGAKPKGFCYALPHDDYSSIAEREGADEEELKKINGNSPVYPSKKIWLP